MKALRMEADVPPAAEASLEHTTCFLLRWPCSLFGGEGGGLASDVGVFILAVLIRQDLPVDYDSPVHFYRLAHGRAPVPTGPPGKDMGDVGMSLLAVLEGGGVEEV